MHHTSLILLLTLSLTSLVIAHNLISPCPRYFAYEADSKEPGTWYGVITMISDFDTNGVYAHISLNKPALQFGNWYSSVYTEDKKEYILSNSKDGLKANVPKKIRFFVKYNISEEPPVIEWIIANSKKVCPDAKIPETTTEHLKPITSIQLYLESKPSKVQTKPTTRKPTTASPKDEESHSSDFHTTPVPSDNDICGTVVVAPQPLITYGQPTHEGEFPWHVAIYHSRGIDWTYICGATLVSKDFVITVAHCVTTPRSAKPLNLDNLSIYLGKHYLRRYSNPGIQGRQLSEIIIHEDYNSQMYSDDIALLKLSLPAEYTDYVRPICLWEESLDLNSIVDKLGKVVGWGFDETGKVADQLMQTEMPVVSQDTCLLSNPQFYSLYTSEDTFCAGFRNGTTICNGDSGGGMVFPKSNSSPIEKVWQLRGLISISAAAHNQKCDTSHYVVFTDTAKYLDWIKHKIK